jgi:hypothetical protein
MNALRPRRMLWLLPIFAASAFALSAVSPTAPITLGDLDAAGCQTFEGSQSRPAEIGDVAAALGLARQGRATWSAGSAKSPTTFHYRIGFRQPVPIGAVFVPAGKELRILRPDAAYPGDPASAEAWLKIDAPPRQGGGTLFALPPNTSTRALVISERREQGRSELGGVHFYRERLANVTPTATAVYAAEEFTPPNTNFVPNPASHVLMGDGAWINTGKNAQGFVSRPAVSDIDPTWFLLAWKGEQKLTGLILNSNARTCAGFAFPRLPRAACV